MTTIFTPKSKLILLAAVAVLCIYGEKPIALADPITVDVENHSDKELYPRLIYVDGGASAPSVNYRPIPPKGSGQIDIELDMPWSLFFATGCTFDRSGQFMNCSTGDCGEGSCTLAEPVATMIDYDSGTVKTTTKNGYNCGLKGLFMCVGCDCPTFSCVIDLSRCPENLKVYNNSGSIVACKPGDGLPSGNDCPALGSYSGPPSAGATLLLVFKYIRHVILLLVLRLQLSEDNLPLTPCLQVYQACNSVASPPLAIELMIIYP